MQIEEGDSLIAEQNGEGYLLTRYVRSTGEKLKTVTDIMNRYPQTLKKLAE